MTVRSQFPAFQTRADPPLLVAGELRLPPQAEGQRTGAVLICHGSDGVDGRGAALAEVLNARGLATFEIDMWAARGVIRGAAARPASVPQTLPDAFAALAFLRRQPEIDPRRIAIAGFSWGGVVALLSATRANVAAHDPEGEGFKAHGAFYPVLWSYNRAPGHDFQDLTGAPILIQAGALDAYDTEAAVSAFEAGLTSQNHAQVELVIHPDATHAFDRALPDRVIVDPYAHDGKGGEVLFRHHPQAAQDARRLLADFLDTALNLP